MFKSFEIKKGSIEKLSNERGELYKADIDGQLKSLPPGEWILLRDPHQKRVFLGFANPIVEDNFPAVRVVKRLKQAPNENEVQNYIEDSLRVAWKKRISFMDYSQGCRVVFGEADGLPGLVVDLYSNCALIQVNTAGMDRYRNFIKETLSKMLSVDCYFIDQPSLRAREVLPHYREEINLEFIRLKENNFNYEIPVKNLQKIGWYYDHRENRIKLENVLKRFLGEKQSAVDLFCYGGSWGLHLLRAGIQSIKFVDQAPLGEMIINHLRINGFEGRGEFIRSDVFKWLDDENKQKNQYDIIVSDPPAFAKSPKDRSAALEGYKKLHRKVLKITKAGSLIAFASCTHYVDQNEFIYTIVHAAAQEHLSIQILETGMQGWDHPVASVEDRSNYIKYVLIRVG